MNEDRYRRESEFHDRVFSDQGRESASKFYSVNAASVSFYYRQLTEHCAGAKVLEYGCGPYSQASRMTPLGAWVLGIDISPVAIGQYRRRGSEQVRARVRAAVMNAESLALAGESFHLVCGTGILHHLDMENCLREISRVLRPDGTAVFLEPLGHNPMINLYRRLTPGLRSADEHPLLMSDLAATERYFGQVERHYFHLTGLAAVPLRRMPGFGKLVRACEALDRGLFHLFPFLRKHAWAVALVLRAPVKGAGPAAERG